MRSVIPILLAAMAGCGSPQPQGLSDSRPSPVARQQAWQECLKQNIEPRVADAWADSPNKGPDFDKERDLIGVSLEKCFPSEFHRKVSSDPLAKYGYMWGPSPRYEEMFADELLSLTKAPYIAARDAADNEVMAKKVADDKTKLKQEEPALLASYRGCIFANAARLAVVSEEPAEAVVGATYAACWPQRMALLDLHRRYGDLQFDERVMDRIEGGLAGTLMLTVIQARSAKHEAPPSQIPPVLTSPPTPEEHSI